MSLQVGQQLGSYEITSLIGKGGMGEVYRARDSKLKRDVAIKALPEEFSRDRDRITRFQREAEVLAALNHSNIAAIYELEVANESCFLVMELVEGETLADRTLALDTGQQRVLFHGGSYARFMTGGYLIERRFGKPKRRVGL
jgi:serine/threonine protein kinase